jgi:hypothetical protein
MNTSGYPLADASDSIGNTIGPCGGALVCLCNIIVFGGTARAEGRTVDRPRALKCYPLLRFLIRLPFS